MNATQAEADLFRHKSGAQWAVSLTRWRSESTKLGRSFLERSGSCADFKSTWYQFPLNSYGSETAKEHRLQLLDNFCRTHSLPCVMCDLFSHCAVMWQRCTPVTCRHLWQPHPPITARTVHCGKCRSVRTMLKDDCKHNCACVCIYYVNLWKYCSAVPN